MIDGVKIDVLSVNANKWINNHLLDFYAYTNTSTGELLDGTLISKYKGLKFFITQSSKYPSKTYCSIRGSLHRYFNNGKHNANDFTIEDLQNVLTDLERKFNIDPATSILRNVEFGVNISTPVNANELLKNLVCYGSYPFGTLRIDRIIVGKSVKQQRSELKIYDKSKQFNLPVKNLTRIEIAVKKMEFLKSYRIKTLSDLVNKDKINPLSTILLSYWEDVIYYDKKINWKQLTPFERKKILYYATPRNWEDFTRIQRCRAKKHFKELMKQHSASTTHKDIYSLIAQKTENLTASFCIRINHDLELKEAPQNVYGLTVRIHGYNVDKNNLKNSKIKKVENITKKRCVCKVCKISISHKRNDAKYCSKKCNNILNGIKRTARNQKQRSLEVINLNKLIKQLSKNRIELIVTYKINDVEYSDHLHQSEIRTTKNWIVKIKKVVVSNLRKNSKPIILTETRARKLITKINTLN